MGATNSTPNLHLPQFVGTDKPSWLGDINSAFSTIDTSYGEVNSQIAPIATTANAAKVTAEAAQTELTAYKTSNNAAIADIISDIANIDGNVAENQANITILQNKIASINNIVTSRTNYPFKAYSSNGWGSDFSIQALTLAPPSPTAKIFFKYGELTISPSMNPLVKEGFLLGATSGNILNLSSKYIVSTITHETVFQTLVLNECSIFMSNSKSNTFPYRLCAFYQASNDTTYLLVGDTIGWSANSSLPGNPGVMQIYFTNYISVDTNQPFTASTTFPNLP